MGVFRSGSVAQISIECDHVHSVTECTCHRRQAAQGGIEHRYTCSTSTLLNKSCHSARNIWAVPKGSVLEGLCEIVEAIVEEQEALDALWYGYRADRCDDVAESAQPCAICVGVHRDLVAVRAVVSKAGDTSPRSLQDSLIGSKPSMDGLQGLGFRVSGLGSSEQLSA